MDAGVQRKVSRHQRCCCRVNNESDPCAKQLGEDVAPAATKPLHKRGPIRGVGSAELRETASKMSAIARSSRFVVRGRKNLREPLAETGQSGVVWGIFYSIRWNSFRVAERET